MNTKSQAKQLAGAQAFIAMLAKILELADARVEPKGDSRSDAQVAYAGQYKAVDAAVASALSEHGYNRGFRTALANYLLNVAQGNIPDPKVMKADQALTDDGYRATPGGEDDGKAEEANDFDFEDTGFRLHSALSLVAWVESARGVLEALDRVTKYDHGLRESLEQHDIMWRAPWEDPESQGLRIVVNEAAFNAAKMGEAGRVMASAARVGARHA